MNMVKENNIKHLLFGVSFRPPCQQIGKSFIFTKKYLKEFMVNHHHTRFLYIRDIDNYLIKINFMRQY